MSDDTIITLAFCLCGLSHMADHTMMNAPLERSADVKERPILFNAAMVRAVLDGTKILTRREVRDTGLYAIDAGIHGDAVAARGLANLQRNARTVSLAIAYGCARPGAVPPTWTSTAAVRSPTCAWTPATACLGRLSSMRPMAYGGIGSTPA